MSLQRQHFLFSYLKTLTVGPARVWTRDLPFSKPALSQLSLPGGGQNGQWLMVYLINLLSEDQEQKITGTLMTQKLKSHQ